jgi:hypothetical protein
MMRRIAGGIAVAVSAAVLSGGVAFGYYNPTNGKSGADGCRGNKGRNGNVILRGGENEPAHVTRQPLRPHRRPCGRP